MQSEVWTTIKEKKIHRLTSDLAMLCRAITAPKLFTRFDRKSVKSAIRAMSNVDNTDDLLAASCKSLGACSV